MSFLVIDGNSDVDPSRIPLRTLAAIRGAMWPQAGGFLLGPRPGALDNIFATDFYGDYTKVDQRRGLAWIKAQGYTHTDVGPIVDSDGYHGIWVPHDHRLNFDGFLNSLQDMWNANIAPICFIKPDGWSLTQLKELTPLFLSPRAQRLMRIVVPYGWEPGKYDISSYTWAAACRWARDTWPNALVLIHTVSDVDAPVGTDALGDDNGRPNGEGWSRVAPYIHGWLIQNGPYATRPSDNPSLAREFAAQFMVDGDGARYHGPAWHFAHGVDSWPTFSAWGPGIPPFCYNAECTAYVAFWQRPNALSEAARCEWGDLAARSGAKGYFDGGTVLVPT